MKQVRLITQNFGLYTPPEFDMYDAVDGFKALKKTLSSEPHEILREIDSSGLSGRGGASYPTAKKIRQASAAEGDVKYLICNADEGEPGTFKDRAMIKNDPYSVFEAMTITAYLAGVTEGIFYLREEYFYIHEMLENVLENMRKNNLLGKNIQGSGYDFDISIFSGAGAYICGEETSLIESIEGKSGRPRIKPPYSVEKGLFDKPTLVFNVETLVAMKTIIYYGADEYVRYGTKESKGTKLVSLCGNVKKPGAYEIPFGMPLREIIYDLGGGITDNNELKFVQLGGSSGTVVKREDIDKPYAYESLPIGTGAILVADETVDVIDFLDSIQKFFLHESCGKCTPCREGNRQLLKIITRLKEGRSDRLDEENIIRIGYIMSEASFCGLGKTAPNAILSITENFPEEIFRRR